jgi:hypothetical protein
MLYLGNAKQLKTLKIGDLVFGAEGFEKGRSYLVLTPHAHLITNIDGMVVHHKKSDVAASIYLKCYLDFLRSTGMIDRYAAGGNGGSLGQEYWEAIPVPLLPDEAKEKIARLYYNYGLSVAPSPSTADFAKTDKAWTEEAGIHQLGEAVSTLKMLLASTLESIIDGALVVPELLEVNAGFVSVSSSSDPSNKAVA